MGSAAGGLPAERAVRWEGNPECNADLDRKGLPPAVAVAKRAPCLHLEAADTNSAQPSGANRTTPPRTSNRQGPPGFHTPDRTTA